MRASLSLCALSLALLQGADALNLAIGRKHSLMADMGLLPDGTPMELPSDVAASFRASDYAYPPAAPAANETIVAEYVTLPIDNFARNADYSQEGTFNNRFWVREGAYKPGGPVFIYDYGEADAEPGALTRLINETSFFKQLVDQYNGIGIVWEHRYYGNSTPGPIDINTPPEVFKYLTTEQSLADVDKFARQFKRKNIKQDLTPSKTPWIFVGGSYPAMRATFMREKYPNTIFASYASSAPVEARVDMSVYFEPVWRGMNAYGFGNCTKDIRAAVREIDTIFETKPYAAAGLKERFLGKGAGKNSHATFADALSTIFALWQSYGIDGGSMGLRGFCDHLSTDPATNKTSPAEGWAASKGAMFAVNQWATYKEFTDITNYFLDTNCSGSATVAGDCNLDLRFTDPASISWTWQYCTQWGFLQSANLGHHQLISKFNSLQHQRDICHRQWPNAPRSLLPDWPRTDLTNQVFGGWELRPSNTYWSGGEFDPWRTLSPLSQENNGSPHPKAFTSPPRCGEEQDEEDIFGYVMANAQHCYDFRTTFAGGAVSRAYFTNALDRWLKCFRPRY